MTARETAGVVGLGLLGHAGASRLLAAFLRVERSALAVALAVGVFASPLALGAQPGAKVYRIGILGAASLVSEIWGPDPSHPAFRAFLERMRELAAELVRLKVDVILAATHPGARAAKDATATIPIVVAGAADPVGRGLVGSLARPGGNVTGMTVDAGPEIAAKRLELLKQTVPEISRVAVLTTKRVWDYSGGHLELAARALGLTVLRAEVNSPDRYPEAFAAVTRERADALLAADTALNFAHRRRIVDFAAARRLPAMYGYRESVEAGGLISYGVDVVEPFRRAAFYVDRILRGARPGDLPVEQPTKFELVINRGTARALGLTIPPAVLAWAEVIE